MTPTEVQKGGQALRLSARERRDEALFRFVLANHADLKERWIFPASLRLALEAGYESPAVVRKRLRLRSSAGDSGGFEG